MTVREISLYADGQNDRDAERWKDEITLVWLTVKLSRIPLPRNRGDKDQYPSIESLLPKPEAPVAVMSQKERGRRNFERFMSFKARVNRTKKTKKPSNG